MQVALLHAIRSPSKPLRHVVGTNVAVIVGVGGLPTWPELLMSFVECLESSDPNALEGALDALYKASLSPQTVVMRAYTAAHGDGGGCVALLINHTGRAEHTEACQCILISKGSPAQSKSISRQAGHSIAYS